MTEMATAEDIARSLSAGEFTARELIDGTLDRIHATNAGWNIFISVADEAARLAADESDGRRRAGKTIGPLDGMPVAVKDNIDVAGLVTTNGSAFYRDVATRDAVVIERLRKAGAIIIGKLNMHEGALGATTDNAFWGRCENPRVPGATPGGSSGGSGAAVAGRLVPIALGTDTMGSVRIPAAYCGVWGLKPTRGLVPTRGLSFLSWTLDSIGPLASTATDLALALTAMAGRDPDDPDGIGAPETLPHQGLEIDLRSIVLGVPSVVEDVECEAAVRSGFDEMLQRAARAGVMIKPVHIAGWEPPQARRAGLLVSEAEGGSRIGRDLDHGGAGFSASFRDMLNYGRRVHGERLAAAYRHLHLLRFSAVRSLENVDALILPTAPQRAFPHGTPAPINQADFGALANIAGLPAVAFPRQVANDGAPNSIQIVGSPFSDMRLIGIASALADI